MDENVKITDGNAQVTPDQLKLIEKMLGVEINSKTLEVRQKTYKKIMDEKKNE